MSRIGMRIMTFSGREFYPWDPRPGDVTIEDIAHALSMQCRFNGHCSRFYSVAQHSVIVSKIVPRPLALEGLLHDGAEAYVGDLVRPIKRGMPAFVEVETLVHAAVMARFGLPADISEPVKAADDAALVTEVRDLMPHYPNGFDVRASPLEERIVPMSPAEAKEAFLSRFLEITEVLPPIRRTL